MKVVGISIVIMIIIIAVGQYANAGNLDDYYTEYANGVLVQKAHKVEKRPNGGWNCYPYGDQTVGYYQTKEQYENAYDPAIFAQD